VSGMPPFAAHESMECRTRRGALDVLYSIPVIP
jgi:hypothetical protein